MGNLIPGRSNIRVSTVEAQLVLYATTPDGFISPMSWGVGAHIIERFGKAGVPREEISMVKDTYRFVSADRDPTHLVSYFNDSMVRQ